MKENKKQTKLVEAFLNSLLLLQRSFDSYAESVHSFTV